ncbi:MAG: molybdopterin-dependent oxidoreductase [Dehalococcoidales bacterium]|nr:molybdopterin-dependent oxidoreductase [Dehalococcoidales bacterium]
MADEKSFIKGFGLCSFGNGSNPGVVDVKDGRIIRIRPLHFDSQYTEKELDPWVIEARGKKFTPALKSLLPPFSLVYKKRVQSPNRVLYPLKRVDWDPGGPRNPQNRGKSRFRRIGWDEALEIVTGEIRRIVAEYGPYAVLCQADGHGETKIVHAPHGCNTRLMELLGGYTLQARNPDSWEGWYWGAKHVWGMEPWAGMMWPQTNCVKDIAENTDMILFWGCDPETTPMGFSDQSASRLCYWFSELGIRSLYVCPDLNYGAAVHADKWIPVKPNTDAALQLAIAYTWISEGTYDKDYIATHTTGFEIFKEYVMGGEEGQAKTPRWAEPITGVPARIIKALAREWASRRTSIAHGNGGSYIRGPYSTEPARLEVLLLAMQGVGKPGVNQFIMSNFGLPGRCFAPSLMAAYRGQNTRSGVPKQIIPKTLLPDAILNPPINWYGRTTAHTEPVESQFVQSTYPAEGCREIHMMWTDSPCWVTCWNGGNRMIEAIRSPKIEFVLAQHPWMENDCLFADVILPANTKLEEEDIGADSMGQQFQTVFPEGKCLEPLGESRSDYEIVCAIAEKMGLLKEFSGGKTVAEWIRHGFDTSGIQEHISHEEWLKRGYYVVPTEPGWEKAPAGLNGFYTNPQENPLTTPSGKIEFYAQNLARHFPEDDERPAVPHWIPQGESHQESQQHPRARDYPLLLVSNHPRWRVHTQLDDVSWLREIPTCKLKGPDGYLYEPVWLHPSDALARGITQGDIVRVFNQRGAVLGGAYITERIIPGAVYQDHGARYDPVAPGELDRSGANNTICPHKVVSRNAPGEVTSGFLVEVERAEIEELRRKYPEAFLREYDRGAGLLFKAWVEG